MSTQVVGAKDGSLVLYENVGPTSVPDFGPRGGFISPVAAVESSGNGAPIFGDVDGDGDEDLILGSTDGRLAFYENVGDAGKPSSKGRICSMASLSAKTARLLSWTWATVPSAWWSEIPMARSSTTATWAPRASRGSRARTTPSPA